MLKKVPLKIFCFTCFYYKKRTSLKETGRTSSVDKSTVDKNVCFDLGFNCLILATTLLTEPEF